ncbi:hypothetical protein N7465_007913 [Penicillium sp. CMV-2018d]|nr:hypothetical protein N7465_007913 [Penicillium sp. CMV-2018d]
MTPFRTSLVQPPRDAGSCGILPLERIVEPVPMIIIDGYRRTGGLSPRAGVGEAFPSLSSASNVDLQVGYYRIHVSKVSFLFSASSHTRELSYAWSSGERSGSEI